MNVSRSTFVQRGCVLTALTVAVLLTGFSVTAWAQTTTTATSRFSSSSGTLEEGATTSVDTPRPLEVTIRRSTRSKADPYNSAGPHLRLTFEYNGVDVTSQTAAFFSVTPTSGSTADDTALTTSAAADLTFADSGQDRNEGTTDSPENVDVREDEIELTIQDVADNADWLPEKLVITLTNHPSLSTADVTVRDFTSRFTVTIEDDDPTPKFNFDKPGIQLAKGNMQPITVGLGVGGDGSGALPSAISTQLETLTDTGNDSVLLSVSPADAVGTTIVIEDDADPRVELMPDGQGRYDIGTIAGAVAGIVLNVTAKDVTGFRDEMISLTVMEGRTEASKPTEGGPITASDAATVTILSGEATPTVTFSTSSVSIEEGGTETVHILADTDQGDQVGSATVSVSGDALISLRQGNSAISGGVVSFGNSANAELTIVALSDRELEDGEEKTATVTITDASGANIGDQRELMVTVVGSTAVPVLPLVGQLLLALLLTAGGARLYRRRQQ